MDTKEEEDKASSPYHVLQQISEEAVRVAGEALQGVYSHSNSSSNLMGPRHRRSQSEVLTAGHTRTNSFQRFKCQMQRAWRWGGFSRENGYQSSFNPEVLANQKRLWYQRHSKSTVFYLNMLLCYLYSISRLKNFIWVEIMVSKFSFLHSLLFFNFIFGQLETSFFIFQG